MRARLPLLVIPVMLISCGAPAPDADAPDADAPPARDLPEPVRAIGNEPFWNVDVSAEGGLVFTRLGEEPIAFPYVPPTVGEGEPTSYVYGPVSDATGDHTIQVVITDEPCQDTMADVVHPMTSVVTIDAEELRDCARSPDSGPVE